MSIAITREAANLAVSPTCPLCRSQRRIDLIHLGPVIVDAAARRAWIEGNELRLTGKELRILTYFARRPNDVVSERDLMLDVWDCIAVPRSSRTVHSHLSRLRRKIADQTGKAGYFPNVWGQGWRLNEEIGT